MLGAWLWATLGQAVPSTYSIPSDNVIVAFLGLLSAITVAYITTRNRGQAVEKAATKTAERVTSQQCAGHLEKIAALEQRVSEVEAAERRCREALETVIQLKTRGQR